MKMKIVLNLHLNFFFLFYIYLEFKKIIYEFIQFLLIDKKLRFFQLFFSCILNFYFTLKSSLN